MHTTQCGRIDNSELASFFMIGVVVFIVDFAKNYTSTPPNKRFSRSITYLSKFVITMLLYIFFGVYVYMYFLFSHPNSYKF